MIKVMFNFQYHKDKLKQLRIKIFGYEFVNHVSYFAESDPALIIYLDYLLLKSCL